MRCWVVEIIMDEQIKDEVADQDAKTVIQLIVFRAGNEEFGVKIDAVREIIKIGMITPIPESPDFIKGIINVRGEIVTAIDVKSRFDLKTTDDIDAKHIVVTKQGDNLFGLIVEEVIEVLRIMKKDIKSTPSLIDKINEKYVGGVVSHDDRLIILLNLDQVLSYQELINLSHLKRKKDLEEKPDTDKGNQNLIDSE